MKGHPPIYQIGTKGVTMKPETEKMLAIVKMGTKRILEEGGEVVPTLFLIDGKDRMAILGIPLTDENAKSAFEKGLPEFLKATKAHTYFFVCEAWSTTSERPINEGIAVSDLPLDDQKEIVIIAGAENKAGKLLFLAEIKTTLKGKELGEFEKKEDGGGRFLVEKW